MRRNTLAALALALALLPWVPSAAASHTGWYATNPVEHDDQGRSDEPDFAITGVLGPTVTNKVIDTDLDGIATPDPALPPLGGKVLAPGCTDDAGRQPSGLCGLWTIGAGTSNGVYAPGAVPPGVVGAQGMSGAAAPGAFTPLKSTAVRFLDAVHHAQLITVGTTYLDVNHKLEDSGASGLLASVDPDLGNRVVAGPEALWAWYGKWTDKNGNGVIDARYDDPIQVANAAPNEEFVWYGNCLQFPDAPNPTSVARGFCAYDTEAAAGGRTVMLGFLFPGNHHAYNGGFDPDPVLCALCPLPADLPGRQLYHFLGSNGVPVCADGSPIFTGLVCGTLDLRQFDSNDEDFFGDPLLGPQNSVAPDQEFNDRSGDPRLNTRQWVYGLGWQTYFYDQSTLNSLLQVTTTGCPPSASSPNRVVLGSCRFADVDRFSALSPAAESALRSNVKPALRSNWVTVRDTWIPFQATIDGVVNNALLDTTSATGPVDDRAADPGWSREPNEVLDLYPGARWGDCVSGNNQHNGFCNSYAGHVGAARGFGDLQAARLLYALRPIGIGNCITCVAGAGAALGYAGEAPGPVPLRADGDHRRTLGPGQYQFFGFFGQWQDKTQRWQEHTLLSNVVRTNGPDGWVGNIVNSTATFYYRGYADQTCTTEQGTGVHTHGECHPYLDGAISDPQGLGIGEPAHAEWVGRCDGLATAGVILRPLDGVWSVPIFVWRDHLALVDLAQPQQTVDRIDDFTGRSGDIVLAAACGTGSQGGDLSVADLVILPLGNRGEAVRSIVTVKVGLDSVKDVDTYVGWG